MAALAVGTYCLSLPTGLLLELHNCYHVPSISRNIISVSVLDNMGYHFEISNGLLSFSLNGILFGIARLYNGLYVLDLNNKDILNIETKKAKHSDKTRHISGTVDCVMLIRLTLQNFKGMKFWPLLTLSHLRYVSHAF